MAGVSPLRGGMASLKAFEEVCAWAWRILTNLLLFSLLPGVSRADPNLMSCASWSASGLCNNDPATNDFGSVGAYNGSIGGMSGTYQWHHGVFNAHLKLSNNPSGGIITAFYLIDQTSSSNKDRNHFEIDIEIYGADSPKDIILATNVFFAGQQYLVQFWLPFDATADYHTYSIIWNRRGITWLVDNIPLRVLNARGDEHWPRQPLLPMLTVWPINWGDKRADYSRGPIFAYVRNFQFHGCAWSQSFPGRSMCPGSVHSDLSWNRPLSSRQLSFLQRNRDGAVHLGTLIKDWGWDTA